MLRKDPIKIGAPLGRAFVFTRRYAGHDFFNGPRLAFYHDRVYARQALDSLVCHLGDDPFNYRLLDVWQPVYQKPWTRPRNTHELVRDLADKIHRGELFVYEEPCLERAAHLASLRAEPSATLTTDGPEPTAEADQPRVQPAPGQSAFRRETPTTAALGGNAAAVTGPAIATTPNTLAADPPEPKVRVEAGVFFDGTGNNRGNIQSFPGLIEQCLAAEAAGQMTEEDCSMAIAQRSGTSYLGAETNVSKLEFLYFKGTSAEGSLTKHSISVYVEGVGTKTGDKDIGWSLGTGLGARGLLEKTGQGVEILVQRLEDLQEERIDELVLDVFGFSRGAATARHFVNEVVAAREGALGQAFKEANLDWPDKVAIRFLGVYDTVAAIVNVSGLDFSPGNDRNHPANIHIAADTVEAAVHLTAAHERRQNFALNSLRDSTGDLPSNFGEWMLPGAHSDVGGGYHDRTLEEIKVRSPMVVVSNEGYRQKTEATFEYERMQQQLADVESEGWFGRYNPSGSLEIRIEGPGDGTIPGQTGPHESLHLWLSREVRGEYSRIPLHLMRELAVRHGVPFEPITQQYPDMVIPDELSEIADAIKAYVLDGAPLELSDGQNSLLKQRYIHHSDQYEPIGPLYPHKASPDYQRTTFFNQGR